MGARFLGVTASWGVVAAPDTASAQGRIWLGYDQEEGEAPDLRARAVSGGREARGGSAAYGAGPAPCWAARGWPLRCAREKGCAGLAQRKKNQRPTRPAGGQSRVGQKQGNEMKKRKFISFHFFQSKSKYNFNSIRNLTSNQAIQNIMQQHECTLIVVDLIFGFIFNKIIIS